MLPCPTTTKILNCVVDFTSYMAQNFLEKYYYKNITGYYNQIQQFLMNRRFLKPLFSFWDPFFSEPIYIKRVLPTASKGNRAQRIQDRKQTNDPHETFDNFFKDYYQNTESLKAEEKQFFQKHYPERVGKKFDAYETLGIQKNADIQKIKQAYRTNAIKYHPKNNSTPEALEKFNNISKAYNQLVSKKQTNDYGEDVSTKSLFQDFHREMENFNKSQAQQKGKEKLQASKQKEQGKNNVKTQQKKDQSASKQASTEKTPKKGQESDKKIQKEHDKSRNSILKGAELYSESSYFEYVNGKRKLHVTKMYQKDGKTIKVDRTEQNLNDGSIEVTETFDDGKEVKNKKYIQGANKKQKYIN